MYNFVINYWDVISFYYVLIGIGIFLFNTMMESFLGEEEHKQFFKEVFSWPNQISALIGLFGQIIFNKKG